jgi:type 1 glutamine amidotransferase
MKRHPLRSAALAAAAALCAFAPGSRAETPKKVVVCTVTTGFRHSCIPLAEAAIQDLASGSNGFTVAAWVRQPRTPLLKKPQPPKPPKPDASPEALAKHAEQTKQFEEALARWNADGMEAKAADAKKAFDAELAAELAKLAPAALEEQQIDAVIFANTTGNLPLPDLDGFIRWIENGHAFIGMHAASDTLHGYLPYLEMLQGEFDGHGPQVPAQLLAADVEHPANGGIGAAWDLAREEMYLIKRHDRSKLRTLWFMDRHPNQKEVAGHYPVAWCRKAGQGRVFYTTLGHREDLWSTDPGLKDRINPVEISHQFRAHLLGGIRWALGLAPGSAEPNAP